MEPLCGGRVIKDGSNERAPINDHGVSLGNFNEPQCDVPSNSGNLLTAYKDKLQIPLYYNNTTYYFKCAATSFSVFH